MKDAIIVNIGETLERISNKRIKATLHRVADIGAERFSCPFFLDPKFSARINHSILESKREMCEDPEFNDEDLRPYGEILCERMTGKYGEW